MSIASTWWVTATNGPILRSVLTTTQTQTSASAGIWYNKGGSLAVSPGIWDLSWRATFLAGAAAFVSATLSTTSSSESDIDLTSMFYRGLNEDGSVSNSKRVQVAAAATYYLNIMTTSAGVTISFQAGAGYGNTIITAKRVA